MPTKSEYILKAGAVITFFGESKFYSNANLTEAVALRFLSLNARNEAMFEALPKDWEERVASHGKNTEPAFSDDTASALQARDALLAEKDMRISGLESEVANLKAENTRLKKDNRALKAANTRLKGKPELVEDLEVSDI